MREGQRFRVNCQVDLLVSETHVRSLCEDQQLELCIRIMEQLPQQGVVLSWDGEPILTLTPTGWGVDTGDFAGDLITGLSA